MKSPDGLGNTDLLCLVPAGGLGSRLGCLTAEQAKPSLAVSFTDDGEVIRMIDIPLQAIRELGGSALVSTLYAPQSLQFVNDYANTATYHESVPGTPIDTLLANIAIIESSRADIVGIVPGDALVDSTMLSEVRTALEQSEADAAILSTYKLAGHNTRPVDDRSFVTSAAAGQDMVADLGVHFMRRDWLLSRLHSHASVGVAGETRSIDIWDDIYHIDQPDCDILLHVPHTDPVHIDMGTPENFHRAVSQINRRHADRNDNILFPDSRIRRKKSSDTIALPRSASSCPLQGMIVPEGHVIARQDQALHGARAA